MPDEIKKPEGDNGKLNLKPEIKPEPPKQPPKDFKIAEIWIKNDTVALDAVPNFWGDKLRAIGILEFCKEIVKNNNPADSQKRNLIQKVNMQGFRNFIRGKR